MTYDEKTDLQQHERDVAGLRAIAQGLGCTIEGYDLALDIGAGLGLHVPWLQTMAKKIYATDIIDYTVVYENQLIALSIQKFQRNGVLFDASRVEYHRGDAQSLIYRDAVFDLVFSVNAFEHIPDPKKAFDELLRVTRPGSLVMLQFDPLWHSAYGHHLWSLELDPWAHLVLTPEKMYVEIEKRGGGSAEMHIYDFETNRQPFTYFKEMFEEASRLHFSRSHFNYWARSEEEEPNTKHPNYRKALKRGFAAEDLLVRGVQFVGVRA